MTTDPWTDPIFHGFASDCLPEEHPQAHDSLYCVRCRTMVHAFNNECMREWFETAEGPYCWGCFAWRLDELPDIRGPGDDVQETT